MRAVNLLPRDERTGRLEGKRMPLLVAAGGFALVTIAALLVGHSASSPLTGKRSRLEAVNAELARLPKTQRATVGTGVITQERTDRGAALAAALSTRIAFDRLLSQISRLLPADAWLTGLTASSPSVPTTTIGVSGAPQPSSTSGPQGVTIEGATYSQESVARVLSRLAVVP